MKDIGVIHFLGLLLGNLSFGYISYGAIGFNPWAFLLSIGILYGLTYVVEKLFRDDRTILEKANDKLDALQKANTKIITENIHHEIKPINNNKEKVYI